MGTHELTLTPDLKALNSNDRLHYAAKAVRTAAWRSHAAAAFTQAQIGHMDRAHITATISLTANRRADPGNWYPTAKACVDGFVDAGLLDDDDHTHLLGPDMRRGPKADRFTIRFHIKDLS